MTFLLFCQVKRLNFFADDTNLFILGWDVSTLNQKGNYCIKALTQWFIVNRFHVNVDKTNIMVFPKNKANGISVKLNKTRNAKQSLANSPLGATVSLPSNSSKTKPC